MLGDYICQEALRIATEQDHQAITALSLTCTHLAEEQDVRG